MVFRVKIQQLAMLCKEFKENSEMAMHQSCIELGPLGPSVGTLVPPDSEIQVVAVQNLIKQIVFSYSVRKDSRTNF